MGELDLHLSGEGRHERLWEFLGAHEEFDSSTSEAKIGTGASVGTRFRVWAPNAQNVSLIADHNFWDRSKDPMSSLGSSGVWEIFVPGIGKGVRYKFAIQGKDGRWVDHADPMAQATEIPPLTASVIWRDEYSWNDHEWMKEREKFQPWRSPISIYEVHLGSWRPGLDYRELARELGDYLKEQNFTHVEFLPVTEHPYSPSWGYQVTSFFAPTSRFGTPDNFKFLVDYLHSLGIGVILDWVPAHFPKDEWALARFDGTALYEHEDPRKGEHPDWGTLIFNYGRNEVRNFLVASALFWLREFHIDGLRVDAVASMLYLDYSRKEGEWLPNSDGGRENWEAVEFLRETTALAYRDFPGVMMIAEESTAWSGVTRRTDEGGLGFGFKWNMGWMHDTLHYLSRETVHRGHHHGEITFSVLYAWSENYILPLSHDEVVHGKGSLVNKFPGDRWQKMATLRALYGYMWAHPGKQLIFMGDEFAQNDEWQESKSLDWHLTQYDEHRQIQETVSILNRIYRSSAPLWELDDSPSGFQWLVGDDASGNTLAFARKSGQGDAVISVTNFSPTVHQGYRLPLPHSGTWREIFNSDALSLGGSGIHNEERYGEESIEIIVPPLATIWLKAN